MEGYPERSETAFARLLLRLMGGDFPPFTKGAAIRSVTIKGT